MHKYESHRSLVFSVAVVASAVSLAGSATASPTGVQNPAVGEWEMVTEFQGQQISATMKISVEDGVMVGVWTSMGEEMSMSDIEVDGNKLTFSRPMGAGGGMLSFEGTIDGDEISGHWASEMGELRCSGKRKTAS